MVRTHLQIIIQSSGVDMSVVASKELCTPTIDLIQIAKFHIGGNASWN